MKMKWIDFGDTIINMNNVSKINIEYDDLVFITSDGTYYSFTGYIKTGDTDLSPARALLPQVLEFLEREESITNWETLVYDSEDYVENYKKVYAKSEEKLKKWKEDGVKDEN